VGQAGLSAKRRTPRQYSQSEKETFFERLAEVDDVSAVARELGFVRITCYKWAHRRGIFTSKFADNRRQEFLRLRGEGKLRKQAAALVGADPHSASDWDRGIRSFYGGRVYPDGRVALYNTGEVRAKVVSRRVRYIQGDRIDLVRVERVIDPCFVSLAERERIRDLRESGITMRGIAVILGQDASTISRELARNAAPGGGYMPHAAHRASVHRRSRPKTRKLVANTALRDYVHDGLRKKWSPEQISHRLVKDFPQGMDMRVCMETIYQGIYVHVRGELKRELATGLRRGRLRRKPRRDPNSRRQRFVDPMVPLSEWPLHVMTRKVPGHWEGDLVKGAFGQSAVATLVERTCRMLLLRHLRGSFNANSVKDALIKTVDPLPAILRKSLTWDQGAEMAEHRSFANETKMKVYFCEPASPWQRGSNENTNGLLRQYLPKGTDLAIIDIHALQRIANELNSRPRKSLCWLTPSEKMAELLSST
jgi:IS30 family transposase